LFMKEGGRTLLEYENNPCQSWGGGERDGAALGNGGKKQKVEGVRRINRKLEARPQGYYRVTGETKKKTKQLAQQIVGNANALVKEHLLGEQKGFHQKKKQ